MRVLLTGDDLVEAAEGVLAPLGARLDIMAGPIDEARMVAELSAGSHAAVLVRGNPPLNERVLAAASGLKLISKIGAGIDSVDLAVATAHGIPVLTAGDANADATAEMTIALVLALRRDLVKLDGRVKAGIWDRGRYLGTELRGQTLGIVGLGRIGRRVAGMARALGLTVIAARRTDAVIHGDEAVHFVPLDTLLAEADIVSLHCPLTAATRGLIDRTRLARMKRGALLVNTARGALIVEADLVAAIKNGHIAGAALDTLDSEPPDAGNPLLAAPNVILTPHVAAETATTLTRMVETAAGNIVDYLAQRTLQRDRLVNPAVLERLVDIRAL